jgi:nicotinate dehydrogenase subunit B
MMRATRSDFLKAGGALVVGFAIPGVASASTAATAQAGRYGYVDPAKLDSWIAVAQDGTVTYFTGRIDFGQHKQTAFSQIVAEELDVPYAAVHAVMGDTARTPNQGPSTASNGLLDGAKPLRHAAAEARRVLLELASERLGVPVSHLVVTDGVVSVNGESERQVPYGALIGGRRFGTTLSVTHPDSATVDVQGTATLKDPRNYRIVGQSIPAVDITPKVSARWPRVHNVRLSGMLHARLVLPPTPGAHVARIGGLRGTVPDVVQVVHDGDLVAVVAKTEWAAIKGAEAVDVTWTEASLPSNNAVFDYLRGAPAIYPVHQTFKPVGDVDAVLGGAHRTFEAVYDYPAQNHGMIGPSCGVAEFRDGELVAYAGTQDPPTTREAIAKLLGLPKSSVRVIPVESSGCYGRLGVDDATVAAAFLAKKVGRPVRVQLMRAQEHVWEPVQQPSSFTLRAGIDANGKIIAWDQQEWTWGWDETELPLRLVPGEGLKSDTEPLFRQPGGGESSSYQFGAMRGRGYTAAPLLRGTAMRSPGRIQINFAGEQFMDEIAAATKQDPIAFRLRHTSDPRTIAILKRAAEASGWETRPSPSGEAHTAARIAKGRGIAVVSNQRNSYVATVAHVEVDRQTGKVAVKRIVVAADAGIVVNPVGIRAQIEGATIYATSRSLKEEVAYDKSKVLTKDWVSYPILRFSEVPQIEIALIDRKDVLPGGIGEPPNTTPAAAIGNAIFDATGVRIRRLPYTPSRVRAALG